MLTTAAVHQEALEAVEAGISITPPSEDGVKRPWPDESGEWDRLKKVRATAAEFKRWYPGRHGLGVIAGAVSGYLDAWDFDDRETYLMFLEAAEAAGLFPVVERIEDGYKDSTPSGGVRWLVRFPPEVKRESNQKLARRPKRPEEQKHPKDLVKALIELPDYTIVAPSGGPVHSSGRPYVRESGGFPTITSYSATERDGLIVLARSFDAMPKPDPRPAPDPGRDQGVRPGDGFNATAVWGADILGPHGWVECHSRNNVGRWRRPGKTGPGISATTDYAGSGLLWVFSSSTPFTPDTSYTKFGAYALLNHGEDFKAAAAALAAKGYGDPRRPETGGATPGAEARPSLVLFRSARELAALTPDRPDWIVRPYAAKGSIAEIVAKVKAGKTTFLGAMVGGVLHRSTFLDQPTRYTPVVYLTEERPPTFRETLRRGGLLERDDLRVLSFWDVAAWPWPDVAALAGAECERIGSELLIVDTFPQFARLDGEKENNAGDALIALAPLGELANRGISIIVVRHERKGGGEVGESGRGSSAFAGGVDVVLALKRPEGQARPTLRVVHALSRFDETPATLAIDWIHSAQPREGVWAERFQVLGSEGAVATHDARVALLADLPVTDGAAVPLDQFLTSHHALKRSTCQRALDALLTEGAVIRVGAGKKGDGYRFFRPVIHAAQTSYPYGQKETDGE